MASIGDIIFAVRSKVPDLPPLLPAPTATPTVVTATGSTLPTGLYFVEVTQRNPWGETLPSAENVAGLAVGANQGIQIVSTLLPSATSVRAYLTLAGGASGSEIQYVESTTGTFTISTPPTGFGPPPVRSTAYLMDSDGPQFGVSTLYSWLNEAIDKMMRAVGGMLDYSGVPTVAGQSMYVVPGQWKEITDVWYGGYWVRGGKRAEYFRRNTVTSSVLSSVNISVWGDKQVLEVNYQPDRTAGVTATTADMTAADTGVAIINTGAFLLPFGFAQIGTEIVAYAFLNGGAISGLIRGLGNTVAKAWPSGTSVTELSLFWCGKRLTIIPYQPGNSLMDLAAPQGWKDIIPNYMLAQAKKAELDLQAAKELEDAFFKECKEWELANNPVPRFVQVGGNTQTRTFDQVLNQGIVIP